MWLIHVYITIKVKINSGNKNNKDPSVKLCKSYIPTYVPTLL